MIISSAVSCTANSWRNSWNAFSRAFASDACSTSSNMSLIRSCCAVRNLTTSLGVSTSISAMRNYLHLVGISRKYAQWAVRALDSWIPGVSVSKTRRGPSLPMDLHRCARAVADLRTSLLVESRQHLIGQIDIGVDVLHVDALLERVHKPEHLTSPVDVDGHADRRLKTGLCRFVVDTGVLQRAAHRDQISRLGDDFEAVTEIVDVLGAGFQHRGQHVVFGQAVLIEGDNPLAGEQVGHRAG